MRKFIACFLFFASGTNFTTALRAVINNEPWLVGLTVVVGACCGIAGVVLIDKFELKE